MTRMFMAVGVLGCLLVTFPLLTDGLPAGAPIEEWRRVRGGRKYRSINREKPSKTLLQFENLTELAKVDGHLADQLESLQNSKRREESQPRIVGGSLANEGDFPFIVSLRNSYNNHGCGANLIDPRYLVTAAHCTTSSTSVREDWFSSAWIGGINLDNKIEFEVHAIDRYAIHPYYNPVSFSNDIAVLRLATASSRTIVEISESEEDDKDGQIGVAAGWGTTDEFEDEAQSKLRKVSVPLLSYEDCTTYYGEGSSGVLPGMLCALNPDGGKDACMGDSGGPLLSARTGKLIGLVSWGVGCARPTWPGVYTRMILYKCWLDKLGIPSVKSIYGECKAAAVPLLFEEREGGAGSSGTGSTALPLQSVMPSSNDTNEPTIPASDEPPSPTPTSAFRNVSGSGFTSPILLADQEDACFPGEATVELDTGERISMGHLKIGDKVRVDGGHFSPVYFFGHMIHTGSFQFLRIFTHSNLSIIASPSHYLLSGSEAILIEARKVVPGETVLRTRDGRLIGVTSVIPVVKKGLYNPHTLSGSIVVNDIAASCYTSAIPPPVGEFLLSPQRLSYGLGFNLYSGLLYGGPPFVVRLSALIINKLAQ